MAAIPFFAVLILFAVLEFIALRRWAGVWRWLALVPVLVLVADIALIIVSILYDPTAHNLWPFEIIIVCAGGSAFIGALFLVKKIAA
jgi:hypothetical protein